MSTISCRSQHRMWSRFAVELAMPRVKRIGQGSSSRRRRLSLRDLPPDIKSLSEDAPLEAYLVDTVAQELFAVARSEEHTSELQSLRHIVCRLLLENKKL